MPWELTSSGATMHRVGKEPQLAEFADRLTKEDIRNFLKDIKLDNYTDLFMDNGVDGALLFSLEVSDLEDMGITNGFHRRKVLTKFTQHLRTLLVDKATVT